MYYNRLMQKHYETRGLDLVCTFSNHSILRFTLFASKYRTGWEILWGRLSNVKGSTANLMQQGRKKQIEKCMKKKMEKRIFHNLEIIWFQLFSKHKDIQISPSTKETQFKNRSYYTWKKKKLWWILHNTLFKKQNSLLQKDNIEPYRILMGKTQTFCKFIYYP